MWAEPKRELRVVMVGKTGRGKSALGNSLLRSKGTFVSSVSGESVTSMCKTGYLDMQNGKRLVVVDTPGLFDTRISNDEISKELGRCIALASPGPHAFLFVLSVDRFTKEELDTIDHLQKLFGADVTKFVIFVFNGKDSLEYEGITLEEHIRKSPPKLQSLIHRCCSRMATINNRAPPASKEYDVNKILSLVEQTIRFNGGKHYTDAMFVAADEVYQNKIRELEVKFGTRITELELREKFRKEAEHNDGILVTFAKELKLILVGSKGVGKSSVGNSLLNTDAFKSRPLETSSLASCNMAANEAYGANLLIMDTSGIIDNCDNPLSHQMASSINISTPVIFVVVIKLKYQYTYTPEELDISARLKGLFGKDVMNNALVVFTEKEMLEHDSLTLDDYIRKSPEQLRQLMKECNNRVAVINNHENTSERQQDVRKILTIAKGIKSSHNSKMSDEVKHVSGQPEIRLILIGNKSAGKSSLGNSLLQRKVFTASNPEDIQGSTQWSDGTKLIIVDTPGIADPETPTTKTFEELTRRVELLHPGPHVFIMVLTIDRFTQEDVDAIKYIKYWFGEDITRYLVVVFTGKDSLNYHGKTLDKHIQDSREELKSFIRECNGRVTAINNRDKYPGIGDVVDLVQQTIKDNKDGFYNQQMYTNAVKERQGKPNLMDTAHFSKQKDLRLRGLEEKQANELKAKEKESV